MFHFFNIQTTILWEVHYLVGVCKMHSCRLESEFHSTESTSFVLLVKERIICSHATKGALQM